jgi:hypothetical protein
MGLLVMALNGGTTVAPPQIYLEERRSTVCQSGVGSVPSTAPQCGQYTKMTRIPHCPVAFTGFVCAGTGASCPSTSSMRLPHFGQERYSAGTSGRLFDAAT